MSNHKRSIPVQKAVELTNLTRKGLAALESMMDAGAFTTLLKYDGVYAQLHIFEDHVLAFSRTGELLLSVNNDILNDALNTFNAGDIVIGELFIIGQPHPVINGAARQQSPHPELQFIVHDYLSAGHQLNWLSRFGAARIKLDASEGSAIFIAQTVDELSGTFPTEDVAQTYVDEADRMGIALDGLIVRDNRALFVPGSGRDGGVYKVKPRAAGDFLVVGLEKGEGKYEGQTGALILETRKGVQCKAGTGLSDDDRLNVAALFALSQQRGEPFIAEVTYLGVTDKGCLREPSIKALRWDKESWDYV